MDITFLTWAFLIVFMVHNFEEIISIEYWMKRVFPSIKESLPKLISKDLEKEKDMTAGQFSIAVCVLFVAVSLLLVISLLMTDLYFLFLGANLFFALNIITHPLQALYLRKYVPGLITSILVILPYNIHLFNSLYQEAVLNLLTLVLSVIVAILFIPLLLLSHKIAHAWKIKLT